MYGNSIVYVLNRAHYGEDAPSYLNDTWNEVVDAIQRPRNVEYEVSPSSQLPSSKLELVLPFC